MAEATERPTGATATSAVGPRALNTFRCVFLVNMRYKYQKSRLETREEYFAARDQIDAMLLAKAYGERNFRRMALQLVRCVPNS